MSSSSSSSSSSPEENCRSINRSVAHPTHNTSRPSIATHLSATYRQHTRQRYERLIATRRAIQHEFLRQLNKARADGRFKFQPREKEPWGIQRRVIQAVNQQYCGVIIENGSLERRWILMKTNKDQVSYWVRKLRENGYVATSCEQDCSTSRRNAKKFHQAEQERVRDMVLNGTFEGRVISDRQTARNNGFPTEITVSASTVRRIMRNT